MDIGLLKIGPGLVRPERKSRKESVAVETNASCYERVWVVNTEVELYRYRSRRTGFAVELVTRD